MHRAEIRGLSIAYERSGSGPVLALLHGFACDSRAWRPQLEGLAGDFTVVAWDAPGAGLSADPPDTFETADWADCLAGLLDALGTRSAHVVGLSWGGIVAQEFYRRHSARTSSLVLAGTYAGWYGSLPGPAVEDRLATCLRYAERPADELVSALLPSMFGPSAAQEVRDELAGIMSDVHPLGFRLMSLSTASDRRAGLHTIQVPTLLVWGEADARSPVGVAHQLGDAIPGARLVTIPGAGHVSNLEAPSQFNAAVLDFCRSVASSEPAESHP
jgi:pimeloyl-ACP methyl ester carboxylesterase